MPPTARSSLAATGYLLDQTPELPDLPAATARAELAGEPPPLGPYRTYQVPIADIATVTGLDLGPLVGADRFPSAVTVSAERADLRQRLPPAAGGCSCTTAADIRL